MLSFEHSTADCKVVRMSCIQPRSEAIVLHKKRCTDPFLKVSGHKSLPQVERLNNSGVFFTIHRINHNEQSV